MQKDQDHALPRETESRQEYRKPLRKSAVLILPDGGRLETRTVSISSSDIEIIVDDPLKLGLECALEFEAFLNGQKKSIQLQGRVVYSILQGVSGFKTGLSLNRERSKNYQDIRVLMS